MVCRGDTWQDHIEAEHLEMRGNQGAVCATIREPVFIYQSNRYPGRRLYYRPFTLPHPFYSTYTLVVVQYEGEGSRRGGEIVSVYATANIKARDILIWSKYNTKAGS